MPGYLNPQGDITDEELDKIAGLGIIPDKQSALDRQMKTAEALRYNNMPEMRGNSRIQTAANPLEFLASGIQSVQAEKELRRLRSEQTQMLHDTTEGRKLYFKMLQSGMLPSSRPQAPTGPGVLTNPYQNPDGSEQG